MCDFFQLNSKKLIIFAILIAAWTVVVELQIWSSYVLPAPMTVWESAMEMMVSGELLEATLVSFKRIFLGFGIAFIFAFVLGLIGALFPKLRPYYTAFVDFIRHIPPLSLIPLLILMLNFWIKKVLKKYPPHFYREGN